LHATTHFDFVRRDHVRLLEELLRVLPWPVLWNLDSAFLLLPVLSLLLLRRLPTSDISVKHIGGDNIDALLAQVLDNFAQSPVLTDELERGFGSNAPDGLEIVTPEENAKVYKLSRERW
jgi:hypothetical protein